MTKLNDMYGHPLWVDLLAVTGLQSKGEMLIVATGRGNLEFRACYADEMPEYMDRLNSRIFEARQLNPTPC